MLAEINSSEIGEWMAYFNIEPWGKEQERSAQIGAIIANGNRGKDSPVIRACDVMPDVPEPEPEGPKSSQELKGKISNYFGAKRAQKRRGR